MNSQRITRAVTSLLWIAAAPFSTNSAEAQCVITEDQRVVSSTPGAVDNFGQALAIDGNVFVSGAPNEDAVSGDSGAAYVFRFDGSSWVEEQKLTASDGSSDDLFGYAVGVWQDRIVIGSPQNDGVASDAGALYVFEFDGVTWRQVEKIVASDAQPFDYLGWSVAVDGDRIAAGAWGIDDLANASGGAYAFEFDGSQWQEMEKFLSTNPGDFDFFGWSVDLEGDDLIVGAYGEDSQLFNEGASYLYHHDGSAWSLQQKLVPANAAQTLDSGYDVALSGGKALVGTLGDGAYVFTRSGGVWVEEALLDGFDTLPFEGSGSTVDLCGDTAVISAIFHHHDGFVDSGAGYVFQFDGSQWTQMQKIVSSTLDANHFFGFGLAIDDRTVIAGSAEDEAGQSGAGAAFVYPLASIALDAEPNDPGLGDPVDFNTCGGVPGNPAALFVSAIDGFPFTRKLVCGNLSGLGSWGLSFNIPNIPELSGLNVTFVTFALDGTGTVVVSNDETIAIQ